MVPLKCWPFKSNQLKSQCKRGRGLTKRLHLNCVEMSAALQAGICIEKAVLCLQSAYNRIYTTVHITSWMTLYRRRHGSCCSLFNKNKVFKAPRATLSGAFELMPQQGRVVHNGEQIRTSDLGASVRPRSFSTDRWGILNNRGQMCSHDCGARAAHAPQVWAHPRRRERRSKPASGARGVCESDKIFWGCAGERICFCSIPDCLTVKKVEPIWSVIF